MASRKAGGRSTAVRPRRASPRRRDAPLDTAPERYIARVSVATGEEIPGPIDPDELLVHAHRDTHPVAIAAEFLASRLIQLTRNEAIVTRCLRGVNSLGMLAGDVVGRLSGDRALGARAKRVLGVVERIWQFRFREPTQRSEAQIRRSVATLQADAQRALRGRRSQLCVLVTGATGFVGQEILHQAARDRRIAEVVALIRPRQVRERATGRVVATLSPQQRGADLVRRLHLTRAQKKKFRFVAGDIEQPGLGIAAAERRRLARELTHVVHCAASVSFDDPYEASYRANVLGSRNALEFSLKLQRSRNSAFVEHVAIETSYIHGRRKASLASEQALVFPGHFYNNFYELTKAMASIETDRYLVDEGLRVVQLLPSIVVGSARTGNNRGDTKVVNAPINAFGRAREVFEAAGDVTQKAKALLVGFVANAFPGDPTAQLNIVPVDRVVQGILASLTVPEAIGSRIHLATDNRIRSSSILRICREELDVNVRLADPTIYRNLTLPVVKAILERMNEPRLAAVLEKLGTIFGGYSEWGQPIHGVGNDVRLLGLPIRRPNTHNAFRMLCRHNRYVQAYGRVRDPSEIARRERLWELTIEDIERDTGREAGNLPAAEFRKQLDRRLDTQRFRRLRGRQER